MNSKQIPILEDIERYADRHMASPTARKRMLYFCEELRKADDPKDLIETSNSLLCKLGSLAVHADEYLAPLAHGFDRDAIKSLLADPEVAAFLHGLDSMSLLPLKRSGGRY